MSKTELRIDLLGTSLLLSVNEDPVYLKKLLDGYERLLEETRLNTGINDALKLSLLTGFLLCDKYERLRLSALSDMQPKEAIEAEKITLDLIEKINKALPEEAA
ncbi:MAG: cell division protein ZapA [Spirochaetaceae bacterium]|jgi:hypothetical protein|nr:cell division protein ZapA [Spirochaetaceae bacterium]